MFGLNAFGQIGQHNARRGAAKAANRAKLQNFAERNQNYLVTEMKRDVQYKDAVQSVEHNYDAIWGSLTNQWETADAELDKVFSDARFGIEKSLVEMHKSDYAGSQAGVTASRRAAEGARQHGLQKARLLKSMMLSADSVYAKTEAQRGEAKLKQREQYNFVRFANSRNPTPTPPTMTPMPSSSGLFQGLLLSALTSFGAYQAGKAMQVYRSNKNWGPWAPGMAPGGKDPYTVSRNMSLGTSLAWQTQANTLTRMNQDPSYANLMGQLGGEVAQIAALPGGTTNPILERTNISNEGTGAIESVAPTAYKEDAYSADDTRSTTYNYKPLGTGGLQFLNAPIA